MEKYFVVLLLQIIIFILSFQSGLGLRCYMCNSALNEKCGDPADKMNMEAKECTEALWKEATDTIKKGLQSFGKAVNVDTSVLGEDKPTKFTCQKIKVVDKSGAAFITRTCTRVPEGESDCSYGIDTVTSGHGKMEYCGYCEEDYCNGSSRQSYQLFLLLVPCFAIAVLHWLNI